MVHVPGFEWLAHLTDAELARLEALVELEHHGLPLNADEEREVAALERIARDRMRPASEGSMR